VTVTKVEIVLTCPSGPEVVRVKEEVGCREGGLYILVRVKVIVPAGRGVVKHAERVMVLVVLESAQVRLGKEAETRPTPPKPIVGGKVIEIEPPDGIGSSRVAEKS
jgi:hypothetical protein